MRREGVGCWDRGQSQGHSEEETEKRNEAWRHYKGSRREEIRDTKGIMVGRVKTGWREEEEMKSTEGGAETGGNTRRGGGGAVARSERKKGIR